MKRTNSLALFPSMKLILFFNHTQTYVLTYVATPCKAKQWQVQRKKYLYNWVHGTNQTVCKVSKIFFAYRNTLIETILDYSPDLSFFFWLMYSTTPKSSFIRTVLTLLHTFCPNSLHLRKGHKKAHNTVIKMKTERKTVLKYCFIGSYSIKLKQCICITTDFTEYS